jgi:hypothetical protein
MRDLEQLNNTTTQTQTPTPIPTSTTTPSTPAAPTDEENIARRVHRRVARPDDAQKPDTRRVVRPDRPDPHDSRGHRNADAQREVPLGWVYSAPEKGEKGAEPHQASRPTEGRRCTRWTRWRPSPAEFTTGHSAAPAGRPTGRRLSGVHTLRWKDL